MSPKIRTLILTVVASCSFATASFAPAVSQADSKDKAKVTCDGSSPGDILETTVTVKKNGKEVASYTTKQICGSDGKWHDVSNLEVSKSLRVLLLQHVARQSVTVQPSGAVKTVTRISRSALMRLNASSLTPMAVSVARAQATGGHPNLTLRNASDIVALEANSTEKFPSKGEEEGCKRSAQYYNKLVSDAHKEAQAGNVASFTVVFYDATVTLAGLKAEGCKVTAT
jgi:hypothetical protein